MEKRGLSTQLIAVLLAVLATDIGMLATAAVSGTFGLRRIAPLAGTVGIGLGAATFGVAQLLDRRGGLIRSIMAAIAAAMAVTTTIAGLGFYNLKVMSIGIEASCSFGLGKCVPTRVGPMPLLVRAGPVQRHPVIRLILWGGDHQERSTVETEQRRAPMLGQPLLRHAYGVSPAVDGGVWKMPGSPESWLMARRRKHLSASDLAKVIVQARKAMGWPDTPDTQWWLATDLSPVQMGIHAPGCADHTAVPGLRGPVVRLPFGSCRYPATAANPSESRSGQSPCGPVEVLSPGVREPLNPSADTDIFTVHEFAEAATDPANGWRVLVAPACHNYLTLEIADVCSRNGSMISAPPFDTPAGWQPSLLDPPRANRPARCVDPSDPPG